MTREEIDLYAHICKELGCSKIKIIDLRKENEELKADNESISNGRTAYAKTCSVLSEENFNLQKRIEELENPIPCNNANLLLSAVNLANLVVKILDKKAHRGCDNKVWFGFQNGNGEEVGKDIERIVIMAKKFLSKKKSTSLNK